MVRKWRILKWINFFTWYKFIYFFNDIYIFETKMTRIKTWPVQTLFYLFVLSKSLRRLFDISSSRLHSQDLTITLIKNLLIAWVWLSQLIILFNNFLIPCNFLTRKNWLKRKTTKSRDERKIIKKFIYCFFLLKISIQPKFFDSKGFFFWKTLCELKFLN